DHAEGQLGIDPRLERLLDDVPGQLGGDVVATGVSCSERLPTGGKRRRVRHARDPDRKSTRLNSSHVKTSYAVFCLKKKNSEYVARGHSNVTTGITGLRPHGVHSPTAYCSF